MIRECMVYIARKLNGQWTDHEHPDHPNRPVNKYRFEVSIDHLSTTRDGGTGDQGFVLKCGATMVSLNVFSFIENDYVTRSPFKFRVDSAKPACVLITDVHIKGGFFNSYQGRGHGSFILIATLNLLKEHFKYATIMSPSQRGKKTYRKIGFTSLSRSDAKELESESEWDIAPHKSLRIDLAHWNVKDAYENWKRDEPERFLEIPLDEITKADSDINADGYFSQLMVPDELWMKAPRERTKSGGKGRVGKGQRVRGTVKFKQKPTNKKKTKDGGAFWSCQRQKEQ